MRNRWKVVSISIVTLLWFAMPLVIADEPFYLHMAIVVAVSIIAAASWCLIMRTGQLNFAHGTFIGIGAYSSSLLVMRLGVSFWLALPIAGLVSALIAVLIGIPTLRIKGVYFFMVTFAFHEVVKSVWMRVREPFGGVQGIMNIPPPDAISIPGVMQITFDTKVAYYYLASCLAVVTLVVLYRIGKSAYGRNFGAIRQADQLAESLGINLMAHKVLAFAVACFFAGIAGSFWAHYLVYINPEMWLEWSIDALVYGMVGGVASLAGPVVGVVVLTVVSLFLHVVGAYKMLTYGAILITSIMFLPNGLISLPQKIARVRGNRLRP